MSLTEKSRAILESLAQGHSYGQILAAHPDWSYQDIASAAAEALNLLNETSTSYSVEQVRQKHPRAYEPWETAEDEDLRQMFHDGKTANDIAVILQRQPGAVRSRLHKLGLGQSSR